MVNSKQMITILTLVLVSIAILPLVKPDAASQTEETPKLPSKGIPEVVVDVVVEGVVYCQSCNHSGTWSLLGAAPIPKARVSVICKNYKNRVSYYNVFTTSDNGYFYANLVGYGMMHSLLDHPLHSCIVKLVSSPMENCNAFSNINYGINGAPLRNENKRLLGSNYEAVVYTAGPLAFRPYQCPLKL
ncbi:hypothetical protein Droror1_Dr00002245 [Drosera rotundifolia]